MTKAVPAVVGGKYRIVRRLGQGAMGSVLEARTDAGERVAVKVITTDPTSSRTLFARFEREARAAASIDTPHICKALDMGTDAESGMPYLVMELLDGEDLDQLLGRMAPLPPELALRIAAQACLALRGAHGAGVLHRDIKPANLFLHKQAGGRTLKLLDFGVAKIRPEATKGPMDGSALTRTGSMLGSPLYMSPEQARGYKDIGFRADIWSLGIVLYKMLTGHAPHDDTQELGELIILICTEGPEPIQELAPWVPKEVAAIVHKALALSPNERWDSAEEMYGAIVSLLGGDDSISESHLRPMTEAEKAVIAPLYDPDADPLPLPNKPVQITANTSGGGATRPITIEDTEPPTVLNTRFSEPAALPQKWADSARSPAPGTDPSPPKTAPITADQHSPHSAPISRSAERASAMGYVAVILVVLLVGGGLGAAYFAGLFPSTSAPTTSPSPSAAPSSRTVSVTISPPDAAVFVEGESVPLKDGTVQITGKIGSVHRVKATAAGVEKNVRVVIAETGPVPARIDVNE